MNLEKALLKGWIDAIKFVRSATGLGLVESKAIVEHVCRELPVDNGWFYEFDHVRYLINVAGKVSRGEWVVANGSLMITKAVSSGDIFNTKNW